LLLTCKGEDNYMKMGCARIFCVLSFILLSAGSSYGKHVMGGTVTYKSLGNYKYAISFVFYRDCSSSGNPTLNNSYDYYINPASAPNSFTSGKNVKRTAYLVGKVSSNSAASAACGVTYCSQKGVYNDTITEGTDTVGYWIYLGFSARNCNIKNLNLTIGFTTCSAGLTAYCFLPPRSKPNNSPQLVKDMTPNVCVSKTNVFNAGIYDPDGDSLVFSFVQPAHDITNGAYSGGKPGSFPQISNASGFSLAYPFGTSGTPVKMDSTTGIITATIPSTTGVEYVLTVMVQDYRVNKLTHKATYMGFIRVDLEFVAVNCGSRPAPKFVTDTSGLKRTVAVGQSFCIKVKTTDTSYSSTYDTMTISATSSTLGTPNTFPKPWATFKTDSATKKDSATFCWTPTCDHITYSTPHTVTFTVADRSCNVVSETYSIYVKPRSYVSPPKLRTVDILGSQYIKLQWDTTASDTNFLNYNIYREKVLSGCRCFTLVKSFTDRKTTTWTDSTAFNAQDTSYLYYITSENKCHDDGFSSDTFQSVIVTAQNAATGGLEFDWNAISHNYKDSFAVYADTGKGLFLIDVVNAEKYIFPYCNANIKVQVAGRSKFTSLLSHSNLTKTYNLKDTVKPVKEPILYGTVTNWGEVDLVFTKTTSPDIDHYSIYRSTNGGVFTRIDSVYSFGSPSSASLVYQDKKALPAVNTYCYQVVAVDHCGNRQAYDPHCVMRAKIKIQQRALVVSWTPYSGFTPDTMKLQQYVGGKWITRKIVKNTDTTWSDTGITCVKKTYRLLAYLNSGKLSSVSDSVAGTPTDSIAPATPAWTMVSFDKTTTSQIDISFKTSADNDISGYKLYSWKNDTLGAIPTTLTVVANPGTISSNVSVTGINKYCYDYVAIDSCGNISKTKKHCAIELNGSAGNLVANLNWTKFQEPGVIKYYIERNSAGTWNAVDSALSSDSTKTNSGLSCNVAYSYRIKASLTGGVSSYSNTIVLTPFDTTRPATPVINYVTVASNSSITVSWQYSASSKVKKYELDYKSPNGPWVTDTVGLLFKTATVRGLKAHDSAYSFRVIAIDSCAANKSLVGTVHQSILLGGIAQNLANKLTWSAYGGFPVKQYDIYSIQSGTWKKTATVTGSVLTFNDTALHCNVPYYYKVLATSSASAANTSYSDSIALTPFDTIKPQQVNIRSVTVLSNTSNQITFDKVADPVVTKYLVYVSKNGGTYSLLTTFTKPTTFPMVYKHTGINTQADSFAYQVTAVDSCAGNTSATTQTHQPVLLKGISQDYAATINWTKYKGFAVKNYVVEYYSSGWKTLATLGGTATSYTDAPIPCLDKYYRIRVVPVSGSEAPVSDSIKLHPFDTIKPATPFIQYATVTGFNSILIKWTKSTSNDVRRYDIYRQISGTGSLTYIKSVGDVDNFTDNVNTDSGVSYCYAIKAVDSCANNNSAFSATHCVVNLKADSNTCIQKIFVSWSAYSGWSGGVKNYLLYRKAQSTGADTLIATLSATTFSYIDSLMSNTRSYCYKIVAADNSGTYSSNSNYSCSKIYQIVVPEIYYASKISTSATNGSIVVKWKSVKGQRFYKYYQLWYKPQTSATFTLIKDNIPISTDSFVHTGINTKTLDHDYYLVIVDSCGNKTQNSRIHQSMILTITVGQLIHNISWTPYQGFDIKYYIVQRYQKGQFSNVDTVAPTKVKDLIFPAPCNFNIFYRIMAVDSFGHYAWSDTIGKRALDTIPSNKPTFSNATVLNDHQVQINFLGADSTDTYAYAVQRSTNGSWATAGKVLYTTKHAAMQYIDAVSTLKDQHCYTIITLDSCLNASPSDTFCTITLTGKPLNEANRLNWNKFKGYGIKNYRVLRLIGNTWTPLSVLTNKDTTLLHDSLHCYLPQYYKIMGTEIAGGVNRITYSDSIQLTPFDTIVPPPAKMQYSSVQPDGSVKLLWSYNTRSDVKFFEVWRKINGLPFNYVSTITLDSTYIDKTVDAHNDTISYYIITIDSCNAAHRSLSSDTDRMMHVKLKTGSCLPWINISWSPYQSLPGGADSITIFRKSGANAFLKLKTLAGKAVSYDDYGVIIDSQYTYIIQARSAKTKLVSRTDTFSLKPTQFPAPDSARLIYSTVSRSGISNGAIHFKWIQERITDTFAKGYIIYEVDPVTRALTQVYKTNNLSDTSTTITGINTLTKVHQYKLAVFNLCSVEGAGSKIHQPINLKVAANKNLTASLRWTRYSGAAVLGYDLYRADDKGSKHLIAGFSASDSNYLDTNLVCQHQYMYEIVARLAGGIVSESDSVNIIGTDTIPPARAHIYVISTDTTLKTGGKIGLRWTGNNKPSRSGFNIYRQVNNGSFKLYFTLNTIKSDTVYWQDQPLNTVDNTYAYYITALDSCGNESAPVDTSRSVHLKAKAFSRYMQINWTPYHGFNTWKYVLEKRTPNTSWQPLISFPSSGASYSDSNVQCHVYYEYRIRYTDANSGLYGFSNLSGDTAIDTVAPKISSIVKATVIKTDVTNGVVELDWNASASTDVMGYLIERSTDGKTWTSINGTIMALMYNDSNLNTYGRPYMYRITPLDTCGNIGRGYSVTHETIRLKGQGGNQRIYLNWNPYQGWKVKTYNIFRDGKILVSLPKDSLKFIDTIATCTQYYHYVIEAVADSNILLSTVSNIDSVRPFDNIAPERVYVRSASIDVAAGQVVLTWDPVKAFDVKNYYIYRKTAKNGQMIFIDSTDKTIYYEDISHIKGADCYYVFARDYCRNQSIGSNRACLIILHGQNMKGYNVLDWNSYVDWPDGIKAYNIYKNEDNNGWLNIGTNNGATITYDDKNLSNDIIDYCYQVEAVENDGKYNATSRSTVVCLHQDPYVYVPDAFTPLTTFGLNDSFGPKGMFIKQYHMDIVNRWGEIVFHTDESKMWDGKYKGDIVPGGVYMYMIKVESYNDQVFNYKGNLVIIY
jgi:hypothetical protein